MPKVKNILHFLLILALFSVFLDKFGIPAYKDLLRQDVVVKESHSVKMDPPAITVCMVCHISCSEHLKEFSL